MLLGKKLWWNRFFYVSTSLPPRTHKMRGGHIAVVRTTLLPKAKQLKPWTSWETTRLQGLVKSTKSRIQGSSVQQKKQKNGTSLHYSPKPSTVLRHGIPGRKTQRPQGSKERMYSTLLISWTTAVPRLACIEFCVCTLRGFLACWTLQGAGEIPGKLYPF